MLCVCLSCDPVHEDGGTMVRAERKKERVTRSEIQKRRSFSPRCALASIQGKCSPAPLDLIGCLGTKDRRRTECAFLGALRSGCNQLQSALL